MKQSAVVRARVRPDLKANIDRQAQAWGVTPSEMVRYLLGFALHVMALQDRLVEPAAPGREEPAQ